MFTAKDIIIKPIAGEHARKIMELYHYSGKSTQNSQIHFGVFLGDSLQGALQFGPSIDKRRMATNLGIGFNDFLELNRMALSDKLPKYSESRALGICLRILKKTYKHLRLVISFADACQCGDGTIYRASGFKLHSFKKNNSLLINTNGDVDFNHGTKNKPIAKKSMDNKLGSDGACLSKTLKSQGYKPMEGYQMKYLYFFDKELEKKFKFVDSIPDYVRMYKGKRAQEDENTSRLDSIEKEAGASPSSALQKENLNG